jgi:molecular chaperone GrpE (heat shock protein)
VLLWFFILNSNYTSIKEGANKITAKLSCLPSVVGEDNNMTKWYSVNVTGITVRNETTTVPPQSPPVINSSAQVEPNNKDKQQPLEPKASEEQEAPIFDFNNNDKKIREEIENLRERIMERVEKSLEEKGIELNLP